MQTASPELIAAITASERWPVQRVSVDWDNDGSFTTIGSGYTDDISADVVSVSVRRELTTDLPPECKLFAGAASATATITLAHLDPGGDPAKHSAWFYSPLNTASPLYGKRRKGRPAKVELGFVGANGPEYVTQLVGTVRRLEVVAGGRSAVLEIADRAETMRKQITLPTVIADGATEAGITISPGLNTTFLADWVARRCGYYASPPARPGCKFLATMHGSGYPEVGSIEEFHGNHSSMLAFSPRPGSSTAARWVQSVNTDGSAGQYLRYFLGGAGTISTNNTRTCLMQGWWKFNSTSVDQPLVTVFENTITSDPFMTLYWQASSGELELTFNRSGADVTNRVAVGPVVSPGTGWHYYAAQVTFTSTNVQVTFRFDGTTTGPVTVATPSVTGAPACLRVQVGRGRVSSFADAHLDGLSEDVQVTTESSTSTWDNAFVPTAQIMASAAVDNRLVATPAATEQGWALLQRIAAGEFATTGFTEDGMFTYWPRSRWTTAPYTTSQRTLTATASLKDLAVTEAVDQVRNRVTALVTTPNVAPQQTVWKLGFRAAIGALGSRTFIAEPSFPVGNVDKSITYSVTPGDGSRYAAGTELDGSGSQVSNLQFAVTVLSPTSIKIVVTNPNAFTVYLAGDANFTAAYAGKPYLWLDAQPIDFDGAGDGVTGNQRVEAVDDDSIGEFDEQILELEANEYRQDPDDIQQLVDDLVVDLGDPGPVLTTTAIVADPRLQLGDRVTVVDPDGLAANADVHLSAIETTLDAGGMAQTISSRSLIPATLPVAAFARSNSFEGGSDGVTITTGNSGGLSGDAFDTVTSSGVGSAAPVFRATLPIRNARSARAVAGASGASYTAWTWPAANLDAYSRAYYRLPSLPAGNVYLLQSTGASNGNAAQIRITSSGTFQVTNASDTVQGTSSTTVTAGQVFRLALHHRCDPGGGNGTIEARIFTGANLDAAASSPTETLGPYTTAASTVIGEQRAGATFAGAAVTVDYDNLAVSSLTWPGPTPAPPAAVAYNRGVGYFIDTAEHWDITDPAIIPTGLYSSGYIVTHWNVAGIPGRIANIRAAHPGAKLLAYQNFGGMIAGPHEGTRPTTLVTQEEAAAHGPGSDSWFLHLPSRNISSSTNATPPVITTATAHGLATGERVDITGHSISSYNGSWIVASTPTTTTFTATGMTANGAGGATGTVAEVGVFDDFTFLTFAHVGRASWRAQAASHFAQIKMDGFDGLLLDDVNMSPQHGANDGDAGETSEYLNNNNGYRDAVVAAMGIITPAARAQGLTVFANVGQDPWDTNHYPGYQALLAGNLLNGSFREFTVNWSSFATLFDGATWTDTQKVQTDIEAVGGSFLGHAYPLTSPDAVRHIRYLLATFYTFWNGTAASAAAYFDGRPLANVGEYRTTIGMPLGPKTLVSGTSTDGAWLRYYENGVACVNAKSAGGSVLFTLDGTYLDASGTPVTSVSLGTTTGMVLLKP